MKLFSTISSTVRVPSDSSDLISQIPLPSVKQLQGYRAVTTTRIWPRPLKWGQHSNIHAWQYLSTDFVIMGWGRVRGTIMHPVEPPARTRTFGTKGCWNDHTAGLPFFSHHSGCEPLMDLTALAVSNAFLYYPFKLLEGQSWLSVQRDFQPFLFSKRR